MQTNVSSPTWVSFAIEAVKILGPALLALAGSWIALRYQRKVKEVEIDAQIKLRARELMFEAYQNKLNTQMAELKEIQKNLIDIRFKIQLGNTEEQRQAVFQTGAALVGVPFFSSIEEVEDELSAFGLLDQYRSRMTSIRESVVANREQPKDTADVLKFVNTQIMAASAVGEIVQRLLEKKREQLFQEYLPRSLKS